MTDYKKGKVNILLFFFASLLNYMLEFNIILYNK
jgi:hypothetical protein